MNVDRIYCLEVAKYQDTHLFSTQNKKINKNIDTSRGILAGFIL